MNIEFRFGTSGIPDKIAYTSRLLRTAARGGWKVWVLCDEASIAHLDTALWNLAPTDFVTHCTESASAALQRYSSAVLGSTVNASSFAQGRDVLVNLSESVRLPPHFDQFRRVIEIVSTHAIDRDFARQRWRQYKQQEHTPEKKEI